MKQRTTQERDFASDAGEPAGAPGKVSTSSRLGGRGPIINVFRVESAEAARELAGMFGSRDGNGVADGAAPAVEQAAGSSGGALPDGLRGKFEGSLGADLSDVRIHTGADSANAAAAVGARAYTVGSDIHFGEGQYAPGTSDGEFLIAHEVAHTVQQQGKPAAPQYKLAVSTPGDSAEVEADRAAAAMIAGQSASVSSAGFAIARDKKEGGEEKKKAPGMTDAEYGLEHEVTLFKPLDVTQHCGYVTLKYSAALTGSGSVSLAQKDEEKPKEGGEGKEKDKEKKESPITGLIPSLLKEKWPPALSFESEGFGIHDWKLVASESAAKKEEGEGPSFKLCQLTFYKGSIKNHGEDIGEVTLSVAGIEVELKEDMDIDFLPCGADLAITLLKLGGETKGPIVAKGEASLGLKVSFQAALSGKALLEKALEYSIEGAGTEGLLLFAEAFPPAAAAASLVLMTYLWAKAGNELNPFEQEMQIARAMSQASANVALGKDAYEGVDFQSPAIYAALSTGMAQVLKAGGDGKKKIDEKLAKLSPDKRAAALKDPTLRDKLYRDIFFPVFLDLKTKYMTKFADDPVLAKSVKSTGEGSSMMDLATFEGEASATTMMLPNPAPWYESWITRHTSATAVYFHHAPDHLGHIAEYASAAACAFAPERDRGRGMWETDGGGHACWVDDHGSAYTMRLHDGGIIGRYHKKEDAKANAADGGVWDSNGKSPY